MGRLRIVGIGDDGPVGLTDQARKILIEADLVIATPSVLKMLGQTTAKQQFLPADMNEAVSLLQSAITTYNKPVLVSEGDPLFFGV